MIKIDSLGTAQSLRNTQKKRKASESTGFSSVLSSVEDDDKVAEKPAIYEAASAGSIHSLLSLQEISDEDMATRKSVKQAFLTLDALDELRIDLLSGNLSVSTIRQIQSMVNMQRLSHVDPQLDAILDDIELRAAVEIAKFEMASEAQD